MAAKTPVHEAASKLPTENLIYGFTLMHPVPFEKRTTESQLVLTAIWDELETRGILTWRENAATGDEDLYLYEERIDWVEA